MAHDDPTALPSRAAGFDAESPLYVAVRWLLYAGMLTVIGAVAFQFVVLGFLQRMRGLGSRIGSMVGNRAASVGLAGAALVGGAVVLRLYAQSVAMHGAARAFDRPLVAAMLTTTTWGRGWLLQIVSVVVALTGFWFARRGGRAAWGLAATGAVGLAFTPALSGHAASAPTLTSLAILADALHVVGAGGWLGSLLVLKLAILSIVAATGAYNWRRIKPTLRDAKSAVRLRRAATFEVAAGVLVLVVTAILVATPTGMAQLADSAMGQ